jgi:hypothetical protein
MEVLPPVAEPDTDQASAQHTVGQGIQEFERYPAQKGSFGGLIYKSWPFWAGMTFMALCIRVYNRLGDTYKNGNRGHVGPDGGLE